jgi:hypothetical protein
MDDYDRLEREARRPQAIRDHSAAWARLEPVHAVNGTLRERIDAFCAAKRITVDALRALDTRVDTRLNGSVRLAWAFPTLVKGKPTIPAVKFRDVVTGERASLKPSTFLQPLVIGNRDALDLFVAEGETDAARL